MYFIETLEKVIGREAKKEYLPMQPGDVYQTYADVDELMKDFGFKPKMSIDEGLEQYNDVKLVELSEEKVKMQISSLLQPRQIMILIVITLIQLPLKVLYHRS